MSDASVPRKAAQQSQSSASGHTQMTSRQPYISEPIASKHVCFYKSGDAQFSGLPVVVNSRTFRTFEALLDSLSKRVPLPFGVRTVTTPRGHTAVRSLDQLHHGHSYICSDRRIVKPVDLERAQRKLPPWYHARPVSARRLTLKKRNPAPRGTRSARRNEHDALLHTPKRLVVFRNGEPEVKHTLILQKRTTQSFDSLLQYMSEVMSFPVLRLHTPDGRRVDGLPALILCSGVVVAAGREHFKKRNYDIQKTSPPTWLPAKTVGRLHPIERKKKSSISKSRPFSPSSERYVVEQIHNSIAGSIPSYPAGSLESGQPLDSVAETDMMACLDDRQVTPEDDIEKSFRVNQDGSMTVEMKVRLTIKEEETINWTTTVSRSSVTNQIKALSDFSIDLDAHLPALDDPVTTEANESDSKNDNLSWPEKNCEANEQTEMNERVVSMEQPSSPLMQSPMKHQTQASAESIRTLTIQDVQENSSYKGQLDNGEMVYCDRPIPRPRGTLITEVNTPLTTLLKPSSFTTSKVLQQQENSKEVCEMVLHIFEKQTCQENLSGNMKPGLPRPGTSPDASPPLASSDTVPLDKTSCSFSADVQPETLATYKHQSTTKQLSPTHKPDTSTNNANTTSTQQPVPRSTPVGMSQKASVSRSTLTSKRKPVRVIVKKNYLLNTANLERKRKDSKVDILKEIRKIRADLFNQTGAMKLKEHFRAKAVRKLHERRNKTESEPLKCSDSSKIEDPILFLVDSNPYKALQKKNILHAPQTGTLRRQTSTQEEINCQELCKAMYLPAVHSSSSLMNEYVELWLQKSQAELTAHVEPQTTTEPKDPKIKEDGKERDEMPEYSVFNPESVLRKAVSMRHSCVNATSTKSSLKGPLPLNMMSGQELTPVPLKQSSPPVNSKDEKILETPSASGRSAEKDTSSPINTPQGNSQPSQPSLETIPKNNTMVKASLFNNQPAEKTPSTKGLMDMKETPIHASHIKKPAQEKVQINSEQANQISELMNKPSYDTENGTSLKTIKDIQTQPSSEWRNAHAEKFYTVKMAVSPDMKPVLDQLCHILQSLREITQLRLKKSKSVPDISSCLESTFGSSSRILLAFLSIMTLKDGLQRLNVRCQASCSEAMLMLRSLKVIARIDDPDEMRQKLTDLHTSASLHLLQRWKSFQELCNTAKSHTNGCEFHHRSSSEEEDQAIQVLMGDLGVPEKVREELAAICNQLLAKNMEKVSGSPSEIEENIVGETMTGLSDFVLEDYVNQYVTSVIDKAINAHLRESSTSQIFMAESLSTPDKETTLMTETHKKENSILGSDICEDMSSIGYSFGMGLHEELDLKRTEDRERLEDEKTKEDEMRVERLRGIVEQMGRLEENNSVVENYKPLEVMRRVSANRETKKDLKLSGSPVSCEAIPAPYEGFVCFPDERSFSKADHLVVKHTMSNDNGEQTCSEILGQSQMKPQTLQTQVQIHNPTRIDIVLPEEHVIIDTPQCYTIYQENFPDEVSEYEENEIGFMEEKTNSVTKLISSLNDQKRLVDKMLYNTDQMSDERFFNHINVENLRPKTTTDNTSMDPLSSSLAFSYDTKTSTLARDPEANIQIDRVKSIREMFLAKSNPDIRHRPTHLTTSSSDPSEFLDSIEHKLSISKDDKDACRLAIAKGYVKQTIERLYGKEGKGSASNDNRPSSAHKAKKGEGHKGTNVTSLASIHEARTNATSEPSYFNATDCVTLKTRPGSNDAVLIDKGRWLLLQNQTSPESSLQLEDTYKNVKEKVVESDLDLGKEDAPYSIFGPMTPDRVPPFTEREEHEGSTGTPFTYFHLPNASDPEMETENAKKEKDNTVIPLIKSNKGWAEKHGILTVFSLPDIKKANKVQPMTEATPPVVSQPTKGPSVQTEVSKRSTEPDALEILYVFCGQHCPLL